MQLRVCHLPRNVAGMASTDAAAQELLRDAFTRLIEHVDELTDGLTDQLACYRPTPAPTALRGCSGTAPGCRIYRSPMWPAWKRCGPATVGWTALG